MPSPNPSRGPSAVSTYLIASSFATSFSRSLRASLAAPHRAIRPFRLFRSSGSAMPGSQLDSRRQKHRNSNCRFSTVLAIIHLLAGSPSSSCEISMVFLPHPTPSSFFRPLLRPFAARRLAIYHRALQDNISLLTFLNPLPRIFLWISWKNSELQVVSEHTWKLCLDCRQNVKSRFSQDCRI